MGESAEAVCSAVRKLIEKAVCEVSNNHLAVLGLSRLRTQLLVPFRQMLARRGNIQTDGGFGPAAAHDAKNCVWGMSVCQDG